MGLIARVLSFARVKSGNAAVTDVKCNPGGAANLTPQHFSANGDDSPPLDTDYVALQKTERTGVYAAVGYINPKNKQISKGGEKRTFGRDQEGNEVSQVYQQNDGTIELSNEGVTATAKPNGEFSVVNSGGYFKLLSSGVFEVNGMTVDPSGILTLGGKVINDHNHNETGTVTGPNN